MVGSSRDAFLFYATLLARVLVAKPVPTFAEHAHEKREAGFPPPLWSL
jgi:hypothetical protein